MKLIDIKKVLAVDIETAPLPNFGTENPLFSPFANKYRKENLSEDEIIEKFNQEAGLYTAYSRIVCISCGFLSNDKIILRSFVGDEKSIIDQFLESVDKFVGSRGNALFLGHNIIDFDIPFIRKAFSRYYPMFTYPSYLSDINKKPWEFDNMIDTLKLYKGSSFMFSSLAEVAVMLGLPSPKIDTDGSKVGELFRQGKINDIVEYCQKDVVTTIHILCKWLGLDLFEVDTTNKQPVLQELPLFEKVVKKGSWTAKEKTDLLDKINALESDKGKEAMLNLLKEVLRDKF